MALSVQEIIHILPSCPLELLSGPEPMALRRERRTTGPALKQASSLSRHELCVYHRVTEACSKGSRYISGAKGVDVGVRHTPGGPCQSSEAHVQEQAHTYTPLYQGASPKKPVAAARGVRALGHLPGHEIPKNVEAVQIGVLAAPVHVAPCHRLANRVRVGENRQHVICGVGGRKAAVSPRGTGSSVRRIPEGFRGGGATTEGGACPQQDWRGGKRVCMGARWGWGEEKLKSAAGRPPRHTARLPVEARAVTEGGFGSQPMELGWGQIQGQGVPGVRVVPE